MLNFVKNFFFITVFLVYSSISFANNLAIIDLDYLIENSNAGKLMLENLSNIDKQNASKLKKKKDDLVKLENEIKSKQNIISKDALDQEVKDLKLKVNEFNKEKNLLVNKFNELKNSEISNFFNKISPIINNYMAENSIDILIDKKKIFMSNSDSDITQAIIDKINSIEN